MENSLRSDLAAGRFSVSAELVLGRDYHLREAEAFVQDAGREPDGVRTVSITDLPGGNPSVPPEAFVSCVLQYGLTPIAHLSGKDGNRNFLEARLHTLARMGVENVLALTGDAHRATPQAMPKPVFDLDSVLILDLIARMKAGLLCQNGSRYFQATPFGFFPGAVVNPYKVREPDQMMQLFKLELKVAVGARFIITQLGFNLRKLYELKQYMARQGLGHIPVIASVYIPTATIARMMQAGDIPGCVVTDELVKRLEKEKKSDRLERAALMVAAVRDLGFAGAHIGGFGISHQDVMEVLDRSHELAGQWRGRIHELVFEHPGQFYLLPQGADGLSDGSGPYQVSAGHAHQSWKQRLNSTMHRLVAEEGSPVARWLSSAAHHNGGASTAGLRLKLLGFMADTYRRAAWGCAQCGDCIQDFLNFPGCTMTRCYKELRNGPCGGSRPDGTCEVNPAQPCVWDLAYLNTLAAGEDPRKFARTFIPPRDWSLNRTSALVNRIAGADGFSQRKAHKAQEDGL